MPDWEGSRLRADALTIPCRYCGAPPGEPCTRPAGDDTRTPIVHFPAHICRTLESQRGKESR